MPYIDSKVCLQMNCPFVDKAGIHKGMCLKARVLRQKKADVCKVSTVPIRIKVQAKD